jgi:hypothetical protein
MRGTLVSGEKYSCSNVIINHDVNVMIRTFNSKI